MIDASRERHGLYLLQMIVCHGRNMALRGEPAARIAKLLDWAELVPSSLRSDRDQTAEFDEALAAIAEEVPDLRDLLRTPETPQAVR